MDNVVSWCYITIAEAAEYLQVSDRTVRRLIADGEFEEGRTTHHAVAGR